MHSAVVNYRIDVGLASANAMIRGRVISDRGRPVYNATIILDDRIGTIRLARSNPFGYYKFTNAPTGINYLVRASSKRHLFPPQTIDLTNDISDVNFTAMPSVR
jgi:hypothetical protein